MSVTFTDIQSWSVDSDAASGSRAQSTLTGVTQSFHRYHWITTNAFKMQLRILNDQCHNAYLVIMY